MYRIVVYTTKGESFMSPGPNSDLSSYTSLGSTYNTFPNPALWIPDTRMSSLGLESLSNAYSSTSKGEPLPCMARALNGPMLESSGASSVDSVSKKLRYLPAYELQDGSLERCGRRMDCANYE